MNISDIIAFEANSKPGFCIEEIGLSPNEISADSLFFYEEFHSSFHTSFLALEEPCHIPRQHSHGL